MTSTRSRFSLRKQSPIRVLVPPLLVILGLAAIMIFFDEPADVDFARDNDLCPIDKDAIAGTTVMLVDFRKPLGVGNASLAGDLVQDVTRALGQNVEFNVVSLSDSSTAPRKPLYRLCKPFGSGDLQVKQAKDQRGTVRDCDDLPAQLASHVRDNAIRYCEKRAVLQRRLNAMAARPWPEDRSVTSAYLVEAIEDIKLELAERPHPQAFYLLSDMLQHASWYSHLEIDWVDWEYGIFSELLTAQGWAFEQGRTRERMSVEVFYLPRRNLTDQPRARELHQQFWRDYFEGTEVTFHNQPSIPSYAARPRMNVLTDADVAAQERAAAEQLLLQVQQEREMLQREQQELEAERLQQAEEDRERDLERQRLVEAQTQRELDVQRESVAEQPRIPEMQESDEDGSQRLGAANRQQDLDEQPQPEEDSQPANLKAEAPQPEEQVAQQPTTESSQTPVPAPAIPQPESVPVVAAPETDSLAAQPEAIPGIDQPEPVPAVAQLTPAAAVPPCDFVGPINEGTRSPVYPRGGRWDVGDAIMTVRYVLDDQGETVDQEVAVVNERSSADRARYYRLFAMEAVKTVRDWRFRFTNPDDGSCNRRQSLETTFQFSLN